MTNSKIQNTNEVPSAEELMKKFDKDSKSRNLTGPFKAVYNGLLIAFAVYVLIVSLLSGSMTEFTKLPLFLGMIMVLGFLKFPACEKDANRPNYIPWYDVLLAVISFGCCLYFVINQNKIIEMAVDIQLEQIVVGAVCIICLFELCRRAIGIPLMVVAGLFLVYAIIWRLTINPATTLKNLIYDLFYNLNCGIFSTPVAVCSSFIVIFIIFGSFLEKTGIGTFFVDLANSLVGSAAGGPAKVAVISSALEGMYSGSSVANTVGSGSITIPVMKKTGYRPEFAAAVEAAASTGGQIMPPIMGAAAFLMSQITGFSYSTIVVCAILPAILYFAGIFIMVHLEAKKMGLKGLPKESIPNFFKLILKKGYLLLPIVALVICMNSYTPALSACFAIMFAMAISLLDVNLIENLLSKDKQKIKTSLVSLLLALLPIAAYFVFSMVLKTSATSRALFIAMAVATICSVFTRKLKIDCPLDLKLVGEGFHGGTNNSIGVVVACAMAGIISGVVAMTGLGSTLITLIVPIAEKSVILALFLTMLCCIVLGMGVPTTANYVIMATITAPILTKMGIEMLAAHMFVFYFGIVADITPPVALAAYAGSAIAKSNPLKTGFTASKLAIGAFIIPYIFALNPSMLFIDAAWYDVILTVVTALIGMFGVSVGLQGYAFGKVCWPLRIVSAVGGLLLIIPGILTDLVGLALVLIACFFTYIWNYVLKHVWNFIKNIAIKLAKAIKKN